MTERKGGKKGKNPGRPDGSGRPDGQGRGIGVPAEPKSNAEVVRENVGRLPAVLNELIHQPWPAFTIRAERFREIDDPIFAATLLPPQSPLLTDSYTLLTEIITGQDTSFAEKLAAVGLAGLLIHQTVLDVPAKFRTQRRQLKGSTTRQNLQITANEETARELDRAHPTTIESATAYETLKSSVAGIPDMPTPSTDRDTARKRLIDINAISGLLTSRLWRQIREAGDATINHNITTIIDNHIDAALFDSEAPHLLLAGRLSDINTRLQHAVWETEMIRNPDTSPTTKDELRRHFAADENLQRFFWNLTIEDSMVADARDVEAENGPVQSLPRDFFTVQFFMNEDADTFNTFTQTIPFRSFNRKQREQLFRKLTGLAAIFQYTNPDHPNLPEIRDRIRTLANDQKCTSVVADALNILEDKKAGSVRVSPRAGALATTRTNSGHDIIAYTSEGPTPVQPRHETTPSAGPTKTETLAIVVASGEPVHVVNWGEIPPPETTRVPAILKHLSERFSRVTDGDSASWSERLSRYELREETRSRYDHAVVIPDIIANDHPLSALARIGVLAVQRQTNGDDTSYAVILDTARAGIISKEKRLVLQTFSIGDIMQFSEYGARQEPTTVALIFALSEAALLTQNDKAAETTGKNAHRYQDTKGKIIDWNRGARPFSNPTIDEDRTPQSADTAVVVPTGNEVFLFKLND